MKWIKENIVPLLLIVIAIIQVTIWLRGKKQVPNSSVTEISKAYEQAIKATDQLIANLKENNIGLEDKVRSYEARDSALMIRLIFNQTRYKANDAKLQNVIDGVRNASKDDLRRAVETY